ncbi:hypothetical protein JCM3774_000669 [Rhodotorula dairenensis]
MSSDILPLVPAAYPAVVLDAVLAALTQTNPIRRRVALLVLVLAGYLVLQIALVSRAALNAPRVVPAPAWVREDDLARRYVAEPPSVLQAANHARLVDLIESRSSAYSPALFSLRAIWSETSPVVGVTAVLLHWKRQKGLELVIRHISRYPFIREIIVWNNHPGIDLKASDFVIAPPPRSNLPAATLRIVNSPSNIHDAGKHLACSMATYEHCYFNDDDWLNIYMDTTYAKYIECCAGRGSGNSALAGGRISSNTLPIIHLEHRRWRFEHPDLDLHTGFTWLGTGSFAPRHLSRRFTQQQAAAPVLLSREQSLVADMFFSLWTNTYPEQMPNDLVPIDVEGGEVGWSRSDGVDQWAVVYSNIRSAVRTLFLALTLATPSLVPFPFPLSDPPAESHTRAPCANDACLFTTSLTPFPDPEALRQSYSETPAGDGQPSFLRWMSRFGREEADGAEWRAVIAERERDHPDAALPPPTTGLLPLTPGWTVQEHEARFNALQVEKRRGVSPLGAAGLGGAGAVSGAKMENAWPDEDWWVKNGSWHLAVDGKGTETCWQSFLPPDTDDHFGLTFIKPQVVREVTITGSLDLANVVAWEDPSGGSDSWEVYSVRGEGTGGWEPRSLAASPKVVPLSSSSIKVTLSLEPIRTPTTYAVPGHGNYEVDEEGREVAIGKLKFVSRGRKRERVRVCAWEFEEWRI